MCYMWGFVHKDYLKFGSADQGFLETAKMYLICCYQRNLWDFSMCTNSCNNHSSSPEEHKLNVQYDLNIYNKRMKVKSNFVCTYLFY